MVDTPTPSKSQPKSHLEAITTRWALVGDPTQFVMRYAPAIKKYLSALIPNRDDADEVCQDFLLHMLAHRFAHANPDRGKFRRYLKAAVRNAALMYFRRRQAETNSRERFVRLPHAEEGRGTEESQWTQAWRGCILERTWNALHTQQRKIPDSVLYTVLRVSVDHPTEDSVALAERASTLARRPIRPDSFRKNLSRARRQFAELMVIEVAQTLENRAPEHVEAELIEVGLMEFVRDYLPADWKDWSCFG